MAAIYQADVWCDQCAELIRAEIRAEGNAPEDESDERSFDSDEFPKWASDDDESDSPQHCAAGDECENAEDVPGFGKVGQLLGQLTSDGVQYVIDQYRADPLNALAQRWLEFYCVELPEPPACPMCDGEPVAMGQLGQLYWYRCRDCGAQYSEPAHAPA